MQTRFYARRTLISGLLLASVACGDSGGGSNDKCEDDDSKCSPDSGSPSKEGGTADASGGDSTLAASCSDGTKNGDETDLDCGGSCNPCGEGLMCNETKDCLPLGCSSSKKVCAQGAKPGFTLSNPGGMVPVVVSATSTAVKGNAEIAKILYNWGDGDEYIEGASHKYRKGGMLSVRQRVIDADGVEITSEPQTVTLTDFVPVRFSDAMADKNAQVTLSADKYGVGIKADTMGEAFAVRSNGTVTPSSGVFYFEAESFVPTSDDDHSSIGVGTAAHPLDKLVAPRGTAMAPSPSFGVNLNDGAIEHTGGDCKGVVVVPTPGPTQDLRTLIDRKSRRFAFVVDYRGASNPVIYALLPKEDDTLELRRQCSLLTNAPLHIIFSGKRSMIGPQMRINTGADITNRPFHYTPEQVTAGLQTVQMGQSQNGTPAPADLAGLIQWGFGKTRMPIKNEPPTLTAPADLTVAVNTPVNLSASASDAEDGNLTAQIAWTDLSSQYHARVTGKGAMFTFTPTRIGRYPIEVKVTDLDEIATSKLVTVTVTGTLPVLPVAQVRLQPAPMDTKPENQIEVTPNGLGIVRRGSTKNGAKANQGLYQGASNFWYFEATRVGAAANLGVGLVIGGGNINPYDDENVPWSMSINMQTGIWRNLNAVANYEEEATKNTYGIAVDYRGVHPKVFVIVGNSATPAAAQLKWTAELTEIWEPVYPMLYGTGEGATTATINFGATPFVFAAQLNTLLGAAGAGITPRWGNP